MSRHRRKTSRQRQQYGVRAAMPVSAIASRDEKSNPAFAGITMFNDVPQPHTMPRSYKNYADEGYATNDSVFKCVSYIITNGAAIPPKLYTDANRETEIKSHPLLDKLAHPNLEQDGVTFREAVLGWYHIAGNAFLYAIRAGKPNADGKISGAPDELWVLDPVKVHPLPEPLKGVTGYKFDDFSETQNPIPAANIGHLRTWNPKDPIFGLSPVEVAALMIDQQNAARKWNLALMQNMGKTSGAWVTDAVLGKNERDQLEVKINEKLAGARNAGKIPVLDAGAKFIPNSVAPSELDWLKSMQYNAGQIANVFNIAPQLIGDTSATTYNNMEQAKAASYTEAIFPALDKFYSLLTMWLVPMYPDLADAKGNPTACIYYDKETVEVVQAQIQAQKDAQAERAGKSFMMGAITLNQAQEMLGLPGFGAKGDVFRIGAVLVPADKLDVYAEQSLTEPAAPPPPVPEPLNGQPPPPAPGSQPPPTPMPSPPSPSPDGTGNEPPPPGEQADKSLMLAWVKERGQSAERQRAPWYRTVADDIQAQLRKEHAAVMAAIADATTASAMRKAANAVLANQHDAWDDVLTTLYQDVGGDFAKTAYTEVVQQTGSKSAKALDTGALMDDWHTHVVHNLLTQRAAKVKHITETTRDSIREELAEGVANDETIDQLSTRIDSLYLDQIIPNRSETIARTEVMSASNQASIFGARDTGLDLDKEWIATLDDRTRPDHAAADGQIVGLDEKFIVGGLETDVPGDTGDPGQDINERCTVGYHVRDNADSKARRERRTAYREFMEGTVG